MVIEQRLASLPSVGHPWIAAPVGFVLPAALQKWKAFGWNQSNLMDSKASAAPWLRPGIRFAHKFGLIHGSLRITIQITEFCPISQNSACVGVQGKSLRSGIRRFASLLWQIVVDHPANGEVPIPTDIPWLASERIEAGSSRELRRLSALQNIF
jgi:hypothetical protein